MRRVMRRYVLVTGAIFALLALVDLWDVVQVIRYGPPDSRWYVATVIVFLFVCLGLVWWAWRIYAKVSDD